MKKMLSGRLTWVKITESILLLLLGTLIAVFGGVFGNNSEGLSLALVICVSIFLIIDGTITLLEFWLEAKKNFTFSAVLGSLFIAAGVFLAAFAINVEQLPTLLIDFIGLLLLSFAVIYLIKGIIQFVYKTPIGWPLLNMLIFVVGVSCGIVTLYYNNTTQALQVVLIVIGIGIAILGVVDMIFAIIAYRRKLDEDKKQAEKEANVDGPEQKVEVDAELNGDTVVPKGSKKKIDNQKQELPFDDDKKITLGNADESKTNSDEVVNPEVVEPKQ